MQVIHELKHGLVLDATRTMYPSRMMAIGPEGVDLLDPTVHSFGYVLSGSCGVKTKGVLSDLSAGGWFSIPGEVVVKPLGGFTIIVQRYGYRGLVSLGAIEDIGRLCYIDGCSDTLLTCPPRMGDPCFNHLHFPVGINQTQHTHPSIRFGIVARGSGVGYQRKDESHHGWEEPLTEGCIFLLPAQELHSFRTTESEREMDVIAFHPDSDWGPTDSNHPMLNRTYIGNSRGAMGASKFSP